MKLRQQKMRQAQLAYLGARPQAWVCVDGHWHRWGGEGCPSWVMAFDHRGKASLFGRKPAVGP